MKLWRTRRGKRPDPPPGWAATSEVRSILTAAAPLSAAIGVFGTIYGAAAAPLMGEWRTVLSSIVIFSGAVQFGVVGILLAGGSGLALVATAAMLNARNPPVGRGPAAISPGTSAQARGGGVVPVG